VKHRCTIFILGWDRYEFDKKRAGTRYAKLVSLHPVGSTGHVVHSSSFGARNVDSLVFTLGWDMYGFDKKRIGTQYVELVFLHLVSSVGYFVQFGESGS
jgi:hypothetical protein